MIHSIVLVSAVQQSESIIHLHIATLFLDSIPIWVITEYWVEFLVLYSRFSLDSDFAHGESNGTPLQYSCPENPMDGRAWWAAVHGVAKSWT